MKRTITGRTSSHEMTLGDARQFLASLEGLPDEAVIKAKVKFGKLRSLTVEEDDVGFRGYIDAVKAQEAADDESP